MSIPKKEDIEAAAERILHHAHRTPVMTSSTLNADLDAELFFKCENLQRGGAFKFRGACNAVLSLSQDQVERGVATHSSGNHAQALALAAGLRDAKAYIVMPRISPRVKVEAVRAYGGDITFCEPTLRAREEALAKVVERTGATFIHPYNDPLVIAGQATAAKELFEDVGDLDIVMAPVGGGGLLSGTALSARYFSPGTRIVGAEPEGADDARRSLEAGRIIPSAEPRTIADGLLTSLGDLTFEIISTHAESIATVSDAGIIDAMRRTFERLKLVIEPSAAVPLGALLEGKLNVTGQRVGIIISGGNVDLDSLPWS